MPTLTVVAHITAQPDQVELVKTELKKLVKPTRAEKGCLQYDLHQDNADPARFVFFENWESRGLLEAHLNSQHLKDFVANTEGRLKDFKIQEMTFIR